MESNLFVHDVNGKRPFPGHQINEMLTYKTGYLTFVFEELVYRHARLIWWTLKFLTTAKSEKAGIKDSTIKILPTPSINFFYMLVMNLALEMMLKSAVQM